MKPTVHAKEEIVFLSGLYEGEGSLSYGKKRNTWTLAISMTDLDIVIRFADFFEGSPCGPYRYPGSTKDIWRYAISDRHKIMSFVTVAYKYVGERRRAKFDQFISWYEEMPRKNYCMKNLHFIGDEGRCKECRRLWQIEYRRKKSDEAHGP